MSLEINSTMKIAEKLQNIQELLRIQKMQQKEILNSKEAQEYLNVSYSFLSKLTSKGEITYYKPSGKLNYFKKVDLDSWMLQNKQSNIIELENEVDTYLMKERYAS
jgi:excisionase family DNA binding protein